MKKTKITKAAPLIETPVVISSAEAVPVEPQTPREILEARQQELTGIANAIALYARELTPDEKSEVDDLDSRMEFRLEELVVASKVAEAQIKIEVMKQVLDIMKKPKGIITK